MSHHFVEKVASRGCDLCGHHREHTIHENPDAGELEPPTLVEVDKLRAAIETTANEIDRFEDGPEHYAVASALRRLANNLSNL